MNNIRTMKKVITLVFLIFFATVSAQDVYTLSNISKLTINGTSTAHEWTVTANTMQGSFTMQGSEPKLIDFEVEVADVLSERGATMDKKMHAALKKEAHPKIYFNLNEVKDDILVGLLNIAGVEKTIKLENIKVAFKLDENIIELTGEKELTLQDFDVVPPTAMFGQIIVGNEITVKFDLFFERAEGK